MTTALYAGSFDPFTHGHCDIVLQSLCVFDKIIIAIGNNPKKERAVSIEESMEIIESYFKETSTRKIEITHFTGALTNFAEENRVDAIVRGLRQVSDFSDEFMLNGIVSSATTIPMTYFICHHNFLHVSSSSAREMHSLGMNVDWLINDRAKAALQK
jgi:pantetheine-phosphate adenylyltransferase